MQTATHRVLLLRKVPFRDHDLLLKTFSEAEGATDFVYYGGRKKSKFPYSNLQFLQVVAQKNTTKQLPIIKEIGLIPVWMNLHPHNIFHAHLLSEVLQSALKEEPSNQQLFHYLIRNLGKILENDNQNDNVCVLLKNLAAKLGYHELQDQQIANPQSADIRQLMRIFIENIPNFKLSQLTADHFELSAAANK